MAADVFRGAMQDDVGAEIKWPLIIRGEELLSTIVSRLWDLARALIALTLLTLSSGLENVSKKIALVSGRMAASTAVKSRGSTGVKVRPC